MTHLTESDLAFLARALALKRTVRKGWTRVPGLEDPESVADHSFGVVLLALLAKARDPTLDAEKLFTIAVAHDLAEAVVGDLVPEDYRDAEEKAAREERGMQDLLAGSDGRVHQTLLTAWRDYEEGDSREARLVRDLDKLEMAVQGAAYAREGADPEALQQFWESARQRIGDPALSALLAGLDPARIQR